MWLFDKSRGQCLIFGNKCQNINKKTYNNIVTKLEKRGDVQSKAVSEEM